MSATSSEEALPLLRAEGIVKHFSVRRGIVPRVVGEVRAVDGVSFEIGRGETLGLVGESGCGKTTVGRAVLGLTKLTAGRVLFRGEDLETVSPSRMRQLRRELQAVFQDPYSSLNPRLTVGATIEEGLAIHRLGGRNRRRERVREVLTACGLDPAFATRYPHEFSGGQRQRVGIARALALGPRLLVCDEPVSSLDVSVQSQIVNLLMDLKERRGLAYLFIAHDLSLVELISDRVAVMYLGRIVEMATSAELYRNPLHPYTRALIAAVPRLEPQGRTATPPVTGDVPSPLATPSGCRFHPRCPLVRDVCRELEPREIDLDGHKVSCHVVEEEARGSLSSRSTS